MPYLTLGQEFFLSDIDRYKCEFCASGLFVARESLTTRQIVCRNDCKPNPSFNIMYLLDKDKNLILEMYLKKTDAANIIALIDQNNSEFAREQGIFNDVNHHINFIYKDSKSYAGKTFKQILSEGIWEVYNKLLLLE